MTNMAVQLKNVYKQYQHFQLNNMNMQVPTGEIMGFIGPNGAGKSTTLRILMGLIKPDSGEVSVLGHQMPNNMAIAKADIGFASEDLRLYKAESIQWHMDYTASIYDSWDSSYAKHMLNTFGLRADHKVKGLSHGQRVKAQLLLVLARRPKLLVLDEPTTGLDPVARHEVISELMEVLADEERSIIFSSHNTQEVEKLSDHITFIDRGQLVSCEDKYSFIERWRRVWFEVDENLQIPDFPGQVEVLRRGKVLTIVTSQYNAMAYEQMCSESLVMQKVENLTLEEIFVAEVMAKRQEVNS